jgi:predicted ATPase
MKYRDILQFEPITDVIQLDKLGSSDYREDIIKTFVYPDYFVETIIPEIVRNLRFGERNQKGIQIIGNYGTGKSHLMSLVSLIAENEAYLDKVANDKAKLVLAPIAGKFKVHRFEMQTDRKLWDIVTFQIQRFLDELGVDYKFDPESLKMYSEQLDEMMVAFEEKFPDKGLLIIIDELLAYLKGHAAVGQLNQDLQVLQALGQQCAKGRFAFMFGVQEMIYQSKEFAFAAEMMLKVKDRYTDLTIRKEDVSFVVQHRLLRKSEQQKKAIRTHLEKFIPLFSDMHSHLQDYVELFPVHPSYFDNFQRIRLGRAQREVLKTLTRQFEKIADQDIPNDNPGLITYDQYWEQMMADTGLMAVPDFKTVADTVHIVHDKIDSNFTGSRKSQIPTAKRLVNACAIKLLQGDLNKRNGSRAETFVEDLCITDDFADSKELLVDSVDATAKLVIKATSGQYFDINEENGEYHLRTEGGVNFDQLIAQYAETMPVSRKDEAFFRFIVEVLGITSNPYRTGFQIYTHELEWRSHKITRDGYVFLGNPSEKSTTHPKQHFYMIFMPMFQTDKKNRNMENDEVYFVMDNLSDDFKNLVVLYGAAYSLYNSADTAQKVHYKGKCDDLFIKTRRAFDACYLTGTQVFYKEDEARTLNSYQLPPAGASKMEIFDSVASAIFEDQFTTELPKYPAFTYANQTICHDNLDRYIKGTVAKIIRPTEGNKDGEAVLSGLGCYKAGELVSDDSIYAQTVLKLMNDRDPNMVVNKDEILEKLDRSDDVWYTKDFHLDAVFEFQVLSVLAAMGECEITLNSGDVINASTLEKLRNLQSDDFFTFANIKRPREVNIPVMRELTKMLCGRDLSNQLDQQSTYTTLVVEARKLAAECATFDAKELKNGLEVAGVTIIEPDKGITIRANAIALKGFCDKVSTFTSQARIKNFPYTLDVVKQMAGYKKELEDTKAIIRTAGELNSRIQYLTQAKQYVPVDTALAKSIEAVVNKVADVLKDLNDGQVTNYTTELDEVKGKYIEWYLEQYYKCCLTEFDEQKRIKILNSGEYRACSELCRCTLINTSAWNIWKMSFNQLRTANDKVKSILEATPYAGFNPQTSGGKDMKTIQEFQDELIAIHTTWMASIKAFILSSESQEALGLMDEPTQNFLMSVANGMTIINDDKSARALVQALDELCGGYVKVEITAEELGNCITRPMTIDEATGMLQLYINKKCSGKDRNKVRIVLK